MFSWWHNGIVKIPAGVLYITGLPENVIDKYLLPRVSSGVAIPPAPAGQLRYSFLQSKPHGVCPYDNPHWAYY